jgi:RNA polymerase sigma-70 factor (ECF subfamily)
VRQYQNSVFNVCFRLLGERREAEDLTQEAFLRAFRRLHTFDDQRPFGPWIRQVATNLCLNHLSRSAPASLPLEEERDSADFSLDQSPESILIGRSQAAQVRAAILALPPHYRAVIELRHFQDLSYAEMANTLGLSLQQVKTHLFRARKTLARGLKIHD